MSVACQICESSANTKAYDPRINLYQCAACAHTFTLVDAHYTEKEIYSSAYFDSEHKNWFKYPNIELFEKIYRIVLEHTRNPAFSLLDVGCGRGDLLSCLRRLDAQAELSGIDTAPCASQDFKFIQDDFMKAQVQGQFDAVISLQCIEHIPNPDAFVKKIKELIKPDGLAVISTINSGGMIYTTAKLLNKIGIHAGYNRLFSEHHIHHFTNPSLRRLLEKNGLRVLSQQNHNYSLASVDYPPASAMITLLYKILTAIIFALSTVFRNGLSQTVVCVPDIENGQKRKISN